MRFARYLPAALPLNIEEELAAVVAVAGVLAGDCNLAHLSQLAVVFVGIGSISGRK
jgi:hypothetical protein